MTTDQQRRNIGRLKFTPSRCAQCRKTIRGAYFRCAEGCQPQVDHEDPIPDFFDLCEDCVRNERHDPPHLKKENKSCILENAISEEEADRLCSCGANQSNPWAADFPFSISTKDWHPRDCGLRQVAPSYVWTRREEIGHTRTVEYDSQRSGERNHCRSSGNGGSLQSHSVGSRARRVLPTPQREAIAKRIFPYGNIHMALRFGTVIVENGVPE